jgi:putative transposase
MGLPQAKVIQLSERQHRLLEQERNRHQVSGQLRQRIDIILQAAAGISTNQLVKQLQLTYATVQHWRNYWHQQQAALLSYEAGDGHRPVSDSQLLQRMRSLLKDAPRSGAPARISLAQQEQIQALACSKPPELGLPLERWSGALLAQEAIKRGIVEAISGRYVNQLLKKSPSPA